MTVNVKEEDVNYEKQQESEEHKVVDTYCGVHCTSFDGNFVVKEEPVDNDDINIHEKEASLKNEQDDDDDINCNGFVFPENITVTQESLNIHEFKYEQVSY